MSNRFSPEYVAALQDQRDALAARLAEAELLIRDHLKIASDCIWEDCDQEAVYCPGHAVEYATGLPNVGTLRVMLEACRAAMIESKRNGGCTDWTHMIECLEITLGSATSGATGQQGK